MIDISIIIINYNTYELTSDCINSVLLYTDEVKFEIILVDNASTEQEPILFEDRFPTLRVIRSKKNLGFSKGNNLGIAEARGNYILLLNSDTLLKENSIKKTLNYLRNNPQVGAVSPRLIFPDGTHQSVAQRFPSLLYPLLESLRFQKIFPKRISGPILLGAFFDHKITLKADWIWGAFFLIPRIVINKMKSQKLDESFFMYVEDMQWCKDIEKIGYEVHFFAETEVVHFLGGSSGAKKALLKENLQIFMERNYSLIHRFLINLINRI